MTYDLQFDRRALKEWEKLAPSIKAQLKVKLTAELLENSYVPAAKQRGITNRCKIKLAVWCIKWKTDRYSAGVHYRLLCW